MSSRKRDQDIGPDNLDSIIRWALHDTVADAQPSPDVWERIESRIRQETETQAARPPSQRLPFSRRLRLGWLLGAGAYNPVPGDPRSAWQRQLHAYDMRASLSVVRMLEGKMPTLRLLA